MKNLTLIIFTSLLIISCQQSEEIENVVVIGGGLMGSSTAWEISKQGQNVLLIEQQDSIYTFGSSFGEARISRSLGPNQNIFSFLQQTSVSETKNLIDFLNNGELEELHTREDIYTTSPVTSLYSKSQINKVEELLNPQTVKYEDASNTQEAKKKYGMKKSDNLKVIPEFKQNSGTENPRVIIEKQHNETKRCYQGLNQEQSTNN